MAFDNSPFRYGAQAPGYAGSQVEVDQGLRAFMLGVYNKLALGLVLALAAPVVLTAAAAAAGAIAAWAIKRGSKLEEEVEGLV